MTIFSRLCLLAALGFVSACATVTAPVTDPRENKAAAPAARTARTAVPASAPSSKRTRHTVARGDTLYSIAWRYGYNYKTLAAWNRISPPFVIYPGQVIRLTPPKQQRAERRAAPAGKKQPIPVVSPPKPQVTPLPSPKLPPPPKASVAASTAAAGPVRWQWPTRGKLLKSSSPTAKKGISIAGRAGQKVVAAATGKVVYSGNGLRGYGNLVIIKHNDTYLSAYAHNRELIVKEGETVKAGQQISTMGVDNNGASALHFEIRKNGKPIDPLQQLPRS